MIHAKNLFMPETKKKKLFQDTFFLVLVGNQINLKIYILFIKPSKLNFLCFHRWKKCRNWMIILAKSFFPKLWLFPLNFPQNARTLRKDKGKESEFCGRVKKKISIFGEKIKKNSRKKLSEKRSEFCGIFWRKSKKKK